jgi:hypothetical protein
MPLNSVQQYVKGLLNDLPVPGQDKTIEAYITPPTVEDIDRPKAYIWGGRLRGMRQTAPRGLGFKRLNWVVDVYLVWETLPDGPTIDSEFPLIIDAVLNKTWTTTMPIKIQDPQTGQSSQILQVGEDFELEYPPERMPSTLRTLYWTARLGLDVYEAVQA